MPNVASILAVKGSTVITVKPTDTIGTLSRRLRERRIGAAVVSRDGATIEGVISERDIAFSVDLHAADIYKLPVSAPFDKNLVTWFPPRKLAGVAPNMPAPH